jgi:hypothetical protein
MSSMTNNSKRTGAAIKPVPRLLPTIDKSQAMLIEEC